MSCVRSSRRRSKPPSISSDCRAAQPFDVLADLLEHTLLLVSLDALGVGQHPQHDL